MIPSFRRSIDGLHTWSGLLVGWLLFAIAATGTMTMWRSEIAEWTRPEAAQSIAPEQALQAAVRWLETHHRTASGWYLVAPDARRGTVQAVYDDPSASAGYRDTALDPLTGSPTTMRDTLGGEFFYRFHFELHMPYPWGRILASAAGMLMIIALVSGVIIHRRIFKDFFTMRAAKGKRSWLDAHNLLGVLALPFHLMISVTGVVTLLTLTLPWAATAVYGDDLTRYFAEASPGYMAREAAGKPGRLAPVGPMLDQAKARFAGGRIGRLDVANPGDANALVTISRHDGDQLAYAAQSVSFDGVSGRPLRAYSETRPAQRSYAVLYGLHMGRFGPWITRWLYFLCGLALCATIATGLLLWLKGREKHRGFGHALVARVNVGVIAGVPIAMLVFFYANRLLPLTLAARAEWEVSLFFWAWGLVLALGLVRPPRCAWRETMAAAACAALLLPFVSLATTGRGLWQAVAARDWLFLGADLLLFAFGALFAAIALKAAREAAPKQVRTGKTVPV